MITEFQSRKVGRCHCETSVLMATCVVHTCSSLRAEAAVARQTRLGRMHLALQMADEKKRRQAVEQQLVRLHASKQSS